MNTLENIRTVRGDFNGEVLEFEVFEQVQSGLSSKERFMLEQVTSREAFEFQGLHYVAEFVQFAGRNCLLRLWPSLEGVDDVVKFQEWKKNLVLAPFKTEFQKRVLLGLLEGARESTLTYSELAGFIDSAGATRAVATVMAQNPWPVIFPCHRVLPKARKTGEVGEYGGGRIASGTKIKSQLLKADGLL